MQKSTPTRYTPEQLEVLETEYNDNPNPNSRRRQELIQLPVLSNLDSRKIKVWFQNRRSRIKQREEASDLQRVNHKHTAENTLLLIENKRLHKQFARLLNENASMRDQIHTASVATTGTSCESVVTTSSQYQNRRNPPSQLHWRDVNNPDGLFAIAKETLAEFLSKATGTAVEWVQIVGLEPDSDFIRIIAVSHNCSGVAARACGFVDLEPTKVAENLKDRLSWYRDCRSVNLRKTISNGNGGMIELMYMQTYAPTTLAPACDFWTLRYTTGLKNGSIVICERSLTPSTGGPKLPPAQNFLRAEMLPSGYLICPCKGGSMIYIVDHVDLNAGTVLELLRPLYESPKILAQKMTIAALGYIQQIALKSSGKIPKGGHQPAVLRTFSQRLSRGFNDAVNGFADDGWSVMDSDGVNDVVIAINYSPKKLIGSVLSSPNQFFPTSSGILCAKTSMLLQNVPPGLLIRVLREQRSEWADCGVYAYSDASLRAGLYAVPGLRPNTDFMGSQVITPLAHNPEHEEILEVMRFEGHGFGHDDAVLPRDLYMLQLCSGLDESSLGAFAQLVFAPTDESLPVDAPLLPSGFRVIPLDSKTDNSRGNRTLDLASSLEVSDRSDPQSYSNTRSVLTIAFQFAYENDLCDNVAAMARQYVISVVDSVHRVAMAISPSKIGSQIEPGQFAGASPEAHTLAQWIYISYRLHNGAELFGSIDSQGSDVVLKQLWHHSDAIICCSLNNVPVLTFANQAGLVMLETTVIALQDISLEKILDEDRRKELVSKFPNIQKLGYASLQGGICMSSMGRSVSYDQAVAWMVIMPVDGSAHCLALMFQNWAFVV